jgi:hypothetical protein
MRMLRVAVAVVIAGVGTLSAAEGVRSVPRPFTLPTPNLSAEGFQFATTSVTIGLTDPSFILPCFNCVPGTPLDSLGLSLPLAAVAEGAPLTVVVTGDDVSYDGTCIFSYAIKQTVNTPPVSSGAVTTTCYPSIWLAYFNITAPPNVKGGYVVEGSITYGAELKRFSTVIGYLTVGVP